MPSSVKNSAPAKLNFQLLIDLSLAQLSLSLFLSETAAIFTYLNHFILADLFKTSISNQTPIFQHPEKMEENRQKMNLS